jgi:hypothetical protein
LGGTSVCFADYNPNFPIFSANLFVMGTAVFNVELHGNWQIQQNLYIFIDLKVEMNPISGTNSSKFSLYWSD